MFFVEPSLACSALNIMSKQFLLPHRPGAVSSRLIDHTLFIPPLTGWDYWRVFLGQFRIFVTVVASFVTFGALYAFVKPPVFEASMMLQIGTSSQRNVLFGTDRSGNEGLSNASSEIELLRSRAVIGKASRDLSLNISASPKYFPIIGRKMAAYSIWNDLSSVPILNSYCWGNEKISVGVFEVPRRLLGKKFLVVMKDRGIYSLSSSELDGVLIGKVGVLTNFASSSGNISIRITELRSKPGQGFVIERRADLSVVEEIQKSLFVSESSKSSNIIKVAYRSSNASLAFSFLQALSARYLELAASAKIGDVSRSLSVASSELPELKRRMDVSEQRYNTLRRHYGVANIAELGNTSVQRVVVLKERLSELGRRRTELRSRFGISHPVLVSIDEQIRSLEVEKNATESLIRQAPAIEQQLQQLAGEAKVNTDLYLSVLRSSKELKLSAESSTRDVRMVDEPTEPMERTDSPLRFILVVTVLGLVLGTVCALLIGLLKRRSAT
jgi:tyrosine-protein kinase Etk/Wzc